MTVVSSRDSVAASSRVTWQWKVSRGRQWPWRCLRLERGCPPSSSGRAISAARWRCQAAQVIQQQLNLSGMSRVYNINLRFIAANWEVERMRFSFTWPVLPILCARPARLSQCRVIKKVFHQLLKLLGEQLLTNWLKLLKTGVLLNGDESCFFSSWILVFIICEGLLKRNTRRTVMGRKFLPTPPLPVKGWNHFFSTHGTCPCEPQRNMWKH